MPKEVREKFKNSKDIQFKVKEEYERAIKKGIKSKIVLDKSVEQHAQMCFENSEDVFDARDLAILLDDDIKDRIKKYSHYMIKSTKNYIMWLEEDYKRKLNTSINMKFKE